MVVLNIMYMMLEKGRENKGLISDSIPAPRVNLEIGKAGIVYFFHDYLHMCYTQPGQLESGVGLFLS